MAVSEVGGTLARMNLADAFDLFSDVLPRKVRRLLLVALLLLPSGAFVNWYVQEKTAGYQELVSDLMEDLFDGLLPPNSGPAAPGPAAV